MGTMGKDSYLFCFPPTHSHPETASSALEPIRKESWTYAYARAAMRTAANRELSHGHGSWFSLSLGSSPFRRNQHERHEGRGRIAEEN